MMFDPILQNYKDENERSRTIEHEEIGRMNEQIKYLVILGKHRKTTISTMWTTIL